MTGERAGRPVALVASIVGVALFLLVPISTAGPRAPDGYRILSERTLVRDVVAYGVDRGGLHDLRVAWMGPEAGVRLTAGVAFDRVTASETTSSMCRRVNCLLAVNGDFFDVRTSQPIGGMVIDGALVRSPNPLHPQLAITEDGRWSAEILGWAAHLDPVTPKEEQGDEGSLLPVLPGAEEEDEEESDEHDPDRPIPVVGVNVAPALDAVVGYTPGYHDTTLTGPEWTELTVRHVDPLRAEGSQPVELLSLTHGGSAPIPPDGAVFSGRGEGAAALERLWRDAEEGQVTEVRFASDISVDDVTTSLGGGPVVMRDGRYVAGDGGIGKSRHPRTLVAWNGTGDRWFVTVDGRQPGHSRGMTLEEAADFVRTLGATDALNLDGGGSTTFVQQGEVVNRPIHGGDVGRERPVANAMVALATAPLIVPAPPPPPPAPVEPPATPPPPPPGTPPPPPEGPESEPAPTPEPEPSPTPRILAGPPSASYGAPEEPPLDRRPLATGAVGALLMAGVALAIRFPRR